jgi:Tol biopolymer transport system component
VFFEQEVDGGAQAIDVLDLASGAIERVTSPNSSQPAPSPKRDEMVYLRTEGDDDSVMLLDLTTKRSRLLLPHYLPSFAGRFSADGERIFLFDESQAQEYDVAKRKVVHHYAGIDSLMGFTPTASSAVISRSTWAGDIWIASVDVE